MHPQFPMLCVSPNSNGMLFTGPGQDCTGIWNCMPRTGTRKLATQRKLFLSFLQAPRYIHPNPTFTETPNTETNLQIQGSSIKMFFFPFPAPSQPPRGTSPFLTFSVRIPVCEVCTNAEAKKPQMLPKFSHT